MTTEIQTTIIPTKNTENNLNAAFGYLSKETIKLVERKGNGIRPLSLRPNRSVKKNNSLKPLALRSR